VWLLSSRKNGGIFQGQPKDEIMNLISLIYLASPVASAGVYMEEAEAIEMAQTVVVGQTVDVECVRWIEAPMPGVEFEAFYSATFVVEGIIKHEVDGDVDDAGSDLVAGDEITINFTHVETSGDEESCAWYDIPIHAGVVAQHYLYATDGDAFEQIEYALPIVLEDNEAEDLPECGPAIEEAIQECPPDQCPEDDEPTDPSPDDDSADSIDDDDPTAEDSDRADDDGTSSDSARGCQTVSAPVGMAGLLPLLMAVVSVRRRAAGDAKVD
jgi:hypothetical protein